ncbi:MAG: hypothetical protein NXI32_15495 [bacterium]|nr:hypothetical protein [bacterium]
MRSAVTAGVDVFLREVGSTRKVTVDGSDPRVNALWNLPATIGILRACRVACGRTPAVTSLRMAVLMTQLRLHFPFCMRILLRAYLGTRILLRAYLGTRILLRAYLGMRRLLRAYLGGERLTIYLRPPT